MIRNNIIPQQKDVTISLPVNYIGKAVEIIAYTVDEIEDDKQTNENRLWLEQSNGIGDGKQLIPKEQLKESNTLLQREFGCAKNAFVMKRDFDEELDDFKDYV